MANETIGNKLTQSEFDRTKASLSKDLQSYFILLRDEVELTIRKGEHEGWTPDKLIQEVITLV